MNDNLTYITYSFSILYGSVKENSHEHDLALMSSNETPPRYFVRFTNKFDTSVSLEDATLFENELISLLSYSHPLFHLRALKDDTGIKVIRVYVYNNYNASHSCIHKINNDQLISDYITARKKDLIVEPVHFFTQETKVATKQLQKLSISLFDRYIIPSKRFLSQEQRQSAQEMADVIQSSHLQNYAYTKNLKINENVTYNFTSKQFVYNHEDNEELITWSPKRSLVPFTRGCGRKKTFGILLNSINEGNLLSNSLMHKDSNLFVAENSAIVICS
jgi:hypothetical protein